MSEPKAQSSLAEFGTRRLEDEERVFEYNAWDQVDMDPEMLQEALLKIENQKQSPAIGNFDLNPHQFWDNFYSSHKNRFFKDRRWLRLEFPELFENLPKRDEESMRICEIGCGAGNTVFPILSTAKNHNVFAYACDYSAEAVSVVKENPLYDESRCKALVFDITNPTIPADIEPGTIDYCICIFVLSAIHPRDWEIAASNIYKMLKPGGMVLFRDYGRHDLAQVRFKKNRYIDDNFYCRGDGTRVYFFTNDELGNLFNKFDIIQNVADKRLIVNRSMKIKMYRCWLQGKFRKPIISNTD